MPKPSLLRPHLVAALFAVVAAGATICPAALAAPQSPAPHQLGASSDALQERLEALARRAAPGQLGLAVFDPTSGKHWAVDADVPFIMMSVFKAPVAAVVLSRIEAGQITLDQEVTLTRADVVEGSAIPSVGDQVLAGRTRFTVRDLLRAAVSESDSTAVDALIHLLGGPHVVADFLARHAIAGMRVDMGERGVGRVADNLRDGQAIAPKETRAQTARRETLGYAALLADPRNRCTPAAAVDFLHKLATNQLLAPASSAMLIDLMRKQTVPSRLRGGIPAGADIADKTGTSVTVGGRTAAWNDMAIMTLADGRQVYIAAFLKDTAIPKPERATLFADIARAVAALLPARAASSSP
ncbi:MAG: class A beta-lactamase [Pseudomonadota bacterium]